MVNCDVKNCRRVIGISQPETVVGKIPDPFFRRVKECDLRLLLASNSITISQSIQHDCYCGNTMKVARTYCPIPSESREV